MAGNNEKKPNNEPEPQEKPDSELEKPIVIPEPNNAWDDYQTEEGPPPEKKKQKKIDESSGS
jgi:hypothetical protein